jgi:glycosyltransferase involved in cell wall biosynthesis
MNPPDISVVICTYNRAALLTEALRSLFAQKVDNFNYEIVVIDNNSSDDTPATVESLKAESPVPLRYFRETRQGNAYARNAGVEQAAAPIIAFLDDDCIADQNWLATMKSAFDRDPELAFVGGRVLPVWENDPPAWLNTSHWAPLALLDYGTEEREIKGQTPLGLLTANIAVRKEVFGELGGFLPSLQRVKGSIGSMEDHEFVQRICRSGKRGLYVPEAITWAGVDPERMTKDYHRRWHTGHGHFYAVFNDPEWERSKFQIGGVPSHLYKDTARHAVAWCSKLLSGKSDAAFENECRLRFFYGFFRERATKRHKRNR